MTAFSERYPVVWTLMLGIVGFFTSILIGIFIAKQGVTGALLLGGTPIVVGFIALIISQPRYGLLFYYHVSFLLMGMNRFVSFDFPTGLTIDGLLLLTLIGVFFRKKNNKTGLNSLIFAVVTFWLIYTILELVNPEARSREAWFYAGRGVSLHFYQAVLACLLIFSEESDVNRFVNTWMAYSTFASIWGFKQQYIGLTAGEQVWLDQVGAQTHILFGQLRSFSIYSDAGQFGAAAAHASVFAFICAVETSSIWAKVKYVIIGAVCFWGYAVAGSRGPLIVFAGGFFAYLLLRRNIRLIAIGMVLAFGAYAFLKFTYIGQSNYQIQRMRSALDPNDPSLQVRLANQEKLKGYMASRPFGGGIGSAAEWGRRFSPGTFLAETPTDSWYVKIWVETGVIGLTLYIAMLLAICTSGYLRIIRIRDPTLAMHMRALYGGFVGVLLACYGNQIFGQVPTSTVMYVTIALLQNCTSIDEHIAAEKEKQRQKKDEDDW